MPAYEYKCNRCGERFEVTRKMSDPPLTVHLVTAQGHHCLGALEQVLAPPAIAFRGAGFYVNDYGKGK